MCVCIYDCVRAVCASGSQKRAPGVLLYGTPPFSLEAGSPLEPGGHTFLGEAVHQQVPGSSCLCTLRVGITDMPDLFYGCWDLKPGLHNGKANSQLLSRLLQPLSLSIKHIHSDGAGETACVHIHTFHACRQNMYKSINQSINL